MRYNFISVANGILFFMILLSNHFGWYNPIRIIMSLAFIFMVILEAYFLAKRNKKETRWTLGMVTFGLILDLAGLLYVSGIWR